MCCDVIVLSLSLVSLQDLTLQQCRVPDTSPDGQFFFLEETCIWEYFTSNEIKQDV